MVAGRLRVFIASASEGLEVANAVRDTLRDHAAFDPKVWTEETFKPGLTFIEALEVELAEADFAVLTLTADDQSITRGHVTMAPRDNILLELGLFMGRLGRERSFYVFDRTQDLKIPTDLLGVVPASYERADGKDLRQALSGTCALLANRMSEIGPREKQPPELAFESKALTTFCQRIVGTWWGRQWPSPNERRLAVLQIRPYYGGVTVCVDGNTFTEAGTLFGRWRSIAVGPRPRERTLFFAWEGTHPTISPGETFAGFGHYTFDDSVAGYERADGEFADIEKGRKKVARWTAVELRRVDGEILDHISQIMKSGSDTARAVEIVKALERFNRSEP